MLKNLFVVSATAILGLSAVNAAFAQGGPPPAPPMAGGPSMRHWHGHGGMLMGVQLTAEQKAKLRAMHAGDHQAMHADFEKLRQIDDQTTALLMADGPVDRAKLDALMQQKSALLTAREQARATDAVKVHDLLTPQQLAQARDTYAKMESLQEQMRALMKPPTDAQE